MHETIRVLSKLDDEYKDEIRVIHVSHIPSKQSLFEKKEVKALLIPRYEHIRERCDSSEKGY